MRLTRYRVTNFRSIIDSGWINLDDVTTLVGENETGKTNLLLPLWKLNPAGGGVGDAYLRSRAASQGGGTDDSGPAFHQPTSGHDSREQR